MGKIDVLKNISGKQKAAILLITLGSENSAQIFKHLKREEIEMLTMEIAEISVIAPDVRKQVLQEFHEICLSEKYIAEGGAECAKDILEKALDKEKASEIMSKISTSSKSQYFNFLHRIESKQILKFIKNEHPQTVALILSCLKPQKAGEILSGFDTEEQMDIAKRIALMDITSSKIISEVEEILEKKVSAFIKNGTEDVGGVESIANILNHVNNNVGKNIIDKLDCENHSLSENIKKKMFVFEDIIFFDSSSIQTILKRDIENKDLAIALKGSSEALREHFFSNISKRLAPMIKEDMDMMHNVNSFDIEKSQQKIVEIILRLQETGELSAVRIRN